MPSLDAASQALGTSSAGMAQKALLDQELAAMKPYADKFKETAAQPVPQMPDLQKVEDAPKQGDFGSGAQQWMTAMSVLSALTGAFSKQHAVTALNAFGAGVKGYQEGNRQAFDEAHKQWKDASEAAIENNKILMDKYKEILDNRHLTEQEQLDGMHMVAAQFHDNLQAASTSISQSVSMYDSAVKAAQTAELAHERMALMADKQKEKMTPSLSQDAIDFAAEQYIDSGGKIGLSNYGRGEKATANLAAIHEAISRIAEERGITGEKMVKLNADFAGAQSEARSVGTASGKIELAANSLDESLPLLEDAIKKVDPGRFPDLNALDNYAAQHTGDPDITSLNTALQTTVSDYSTLIARNGQRTDATDAAAKHLANVNMANGQLKAFIAQVRKEKDAQLRATDKTKTEVAGGGGKSPSPADIDYLKGNHSSKESFDKHFGAGASDRVLGGQ